jgi:hypothetical protein
MRFYGTAAGMQENGYSGLNWTKTLSAAVVFQSFSSLISLNPVLDSRKST